LDNSHSRELLSRLANEGERTAAALGIKLPYENAFAAMEEVIFRTKKNTSSMLQDMQRGMPTEIEAINGEIVRHAQQAGLSVPVNECLVSLVKAMVALRQT
jgi:2-dehydropantoate 2-reductase